jgi:hypothetical protein
MNGFLNFKSDKATTYTQSSTNSLLDLKSNNTDVFTRITTNTLLSAKANSSDVYTQSVTNSLLDLKSNNVDIYTRITTNNLLSAKANSSDVYSKSYIDANIATQVQTSSLVNNATSALLDADNIFTGNFMKLNKSLANGLNLNYTISNDGNLGFSSLYLTAKYDSGTKNESGQIWIGQDTGLVLRTNTIHPISIRPNNVLSLSASPDGNVTCFNNLIVNANITSNSQAVVLNNDARLTNQRVPTNNSVDNTKVSDNALSQSKINGLSTDLSNKQGKLDPFFIVAATSPQKPSIQFQQDGAASWTLAPDASDSTLRLQRGSGFIDTFSINANNGNVIFLGNITSNSQAVILNNDSRLTDQRTPLNNSVDNTKVADNALSQSKINGLSTALAGKQGTSDLTLSLAGQFPGQHPLISMITEGNEQWRLTTLTTDNKLYVQRAGTGGVTNVLSFNPSSGNADFNGSVKATNELIVEGAAPIIWLQADTVNRDWSITSDSQQNFKIRRTSSLLDTMTLSMSNGNVSFAGSIISQSVNDSSISDNAISQSKINGLVSALAGKQGTSALGFTVAGLTSPIATSPNIKFNVNSTTEWQFINDTSNSNTFSLQRNTGLGMGDVITINSNGNTTFQNAVECEGDVTMQSNLTCANNVTINNLLLIPNQPTAFLRFIGTQSVNTGGPHKVIPDGIIYNIGNMWNAGQGRFNISTNGLYLMTTSMTLANRNNTITVLVSVRRNGNAIVFNTSLYSAQVNTTQILNSGDFIEIFVQHSGASSTTIFTNAETHVSLTLIG